MGSEQRDHEMLESRSSLRARRWAIGLATALLAFGLLMAPSAALATRNYTPAQKFRRGVTNTTLGLLAIPGEMTRETRDRGAAIGLPLGFVKGIGWFVATEAVGVWEFLTCPFAFPRGFKPIIRPDHPWQRFEQRRRTRSSPSSIPQRTGGSESAKARP